ncbi:hypothetical protein BDA96_02G111400 [Sorghum bicolor]|uniref:RING-type domain-containing protein n=1 Tax=Sorghum bicolor TaxID=4558 RepID=A0A921RLA7_SORBI|nr:hypothetical protein BDA96_02G111400 [Sorghum bicolor]
MDNLKTHSEYADQPQGPQANALSFALPTGQVLDSHMIGQQHANLSSFWFSLEQHRLQLDQVLQLHNEQLRVSLQKHISMHNATLLNLVESVTRDVLMQKHDEIASLRIQLQKKQEDLETTLHDRDEWMKVAVAAYEINQSLIHMLRTVQEANSHVSSNDLDAPSYRGEASSTARTAVETAQPNLICKVCNSGNACMLLLPCQHLCACKPCGAWLATCPICGAAKTDAIEARFVYNK